MCQMKHFFIRTSSSQNHSFIQGWFAPPSKLPLLQNDQTMYNIYIYNIYIEREFQTAAGGPPPGGVEDMEFSGVLKKYHVEIIGVN